ncbi:ATP-binding cassette domain-containing protein [Desulfopila aestuarii]|uniref:Phospholipid/cholesterol/gamma-HCH transport system ATP-binding protein n=1 Tax=Desulfopila aestuarii DSM 18488 TaxID=1121416 RepID=A0A1M7Y5G0_9BACT|nr:ATP-binding cassette domain-containing protein [Desulfopila aestuarii]SHO47618.1 phospholipid/cholesterol/gamma-HCH transport system ATP-binding protein [Desulfopila aestuarii DSM 18488]
MTPPLIELRNVKKSFGSKVVLDGVNLTIEQGQVTTIIGKSGTGKSVMLKNIIGLMEPDEGTILFKGKDIKTMLPHERQDYYCQLSYMFQNNALFDSMTVYENIAFPLEQTTELGTEEIRTRVRKKMEQTDLLGVGSRFPSEISGGMQKRVAFSRALVTQPEIVLFDEPTTGQDIVRRNAILSMIAEYKKKFGFTAIVISHDIPDILFISNRVLVLHQGKIVFQGTPQELESFEHSYVDEFIESLEGFKEHLTGLYSRRSFKMRYHNTLSKKKQDENYCIAIFAIADFSKVCDDLGFVTGQNLLKELGNYISKHFDPVGGFSARQRRSRFLTVLPQATIDEARQLLESFGKDVEENGFSSAVDPFFDPGGRCHDLTILAGYAEGVSDQENLNDVLVKARKNLYAIAEIKCVARR